MSAKVETEKSQPSIILTLLQLLLLIEQPEHPKRNLIPIAFGFDYGKVT